MFVLDPALSALFAEISLKSFTEKFSVKTISIRKSFQDLSS